MEAGFDERLVTGHDRVGEPLVWLRVLGPRVELADRPVRTGHPQDPEPAVGRDPAMLARYLDAGRGPAIGVCTTGRERRVDDGKPAVPPLAEERGGIGDIDIDPLGVVSGRAVL